MKSLYQRAGLTLLCGAVLAGCGGSGGSMALSGTIFTLNKPDLVLINTKNGETLAIASGQATFVFTKLVKPDEEFDIEVQTPPTGAKCTPVGTTNKGKASVYTAYQIQFNCVTNPYTLGGTVTGLDTKGLVLTNGSDTVSVLPPTTPGAPVSFTFPTKVADGSPYGVAILTQPKDTSKVCTVSNNVGNMPSDNYNGVVVTCQ
ncbi:hypothetical protein [Duganella qianjiadongensis]|uniref:Lipoprotein n=1 Tax=Duganella qianjiadongensis TaxID=2692176 RepID=A0ABW9VPF7_9BURK|nr:hypothetical protein [Duganella qianjiadongensis]MYM40495.1 hypothetical protein [Duganella qianjiadongensis]